MRSYWITMTVTAKCEFFQNYIGVKFKPANSSLLSFVVAVREDAVNNREPVILRSYTNPQRISLLPDVLLWEACRATSAAPVYFHPIKVGQYQLVDGGLGANNPLGW